MMKSFNSKETEKIREGNLYKTISIIIEPKDPIYKGRPLRPAFIC